MTLTGAGDLVLHEGSLHIQPPASIYPGYDPAGTGTTFTSKEHPQWNTQRPPKALTVSGGSLNVHGGGAEVLSTRGNAPGLLVSVGPFDWDDLEGEVGDGTFHGNGTDRGDEEQAFSYAGAALAVNVRESGPGEDRRKDRGAAVCSYQERGRGGYGWIRYAEPLTDVANLSRRNTLRRKGITITP